ncbi:MAG: helix-turn-helix domain-containing protein, partial [Methanimicrococcus sp.]|nr:helix-turn-helix domain-containing protein [Methanimicrococcus sp.]
VGVAEIKLKKYGGLFMEEIADYLRDEKAPLLPKQKAIQTDFEKKQEQTNVSTNFEKKQEQIDVSEDNLKKTQALFSQGLSISEISEIRGIPVSKVVDHLERLILTEKIDNVDFLISDKKQKAISSAMEELQIEFINKLMNSIVIEKTDVKCSEEEIRLMKALMVAEMKRKKQSKN